MTSTQAWLGILGLAVTGFFTYLGVRAQTKTTRKAAEATEASNRSNSAIGGFEKLTTSLSSEMQRMAERLDEQDKKIAKQQVELSEQHDRLDELQRRHRAALSYIAQLRDFASVHTPGLMPPIPEELRDVLPHTPPL